MDPEVWGPHTWIFLHTITFNYPENPNSNDKDNIRQFIKYFHTQIPCNKCKKHFKQNLKKHPLSESILSNKDNLIDWMIAMHNEVNKMHGKKIYTRDEVIDYYENIYNSNNNYFTKKNICIILIIILLIYLYCKNEE